MLRPVSSGPGCVEYHVDRAEFLLGCCGSLASNYQGPRFRGDLSDPDRATQALNEIAAATKENCSALDASTYLELKLNGVGARVWRAQLNVSAGSERDFDQSLADADAAVGELRHFVEGHPDVSFRVWYWIGQTYLRAGHPWDALAFVGNLGISRTDSAASVFVADVLFRLSIYDAASRQYSTWLGGADDASLCNRDLSFRNIAELRRRGFQIAEVRSGKLEVVCAAASDWVPYVRITAR